MKTVTSLLLIAIIAISLYAAVHDGVLAYYLVDEREYWTGTVSAFAVGVASVFLLRRNHLGVDSDET